jgi:hypothetical protein
MEVDVIEKLSPEGMDISGMKPRQIVFRRG